MVGKFEDFGVSSDGLNNRTDPFDDIRSETFFRPRNNNDRAMNGSENDTAPTLKSGEYFERLRNLFDEGNLLRDGRLTADAHDAIIEFLRLRQPLYDDFEANTRNLNQYFEARGWPVRLEFCPHHFRIPGDQWPHGYRARVNGRDTGVHHLRPRSSRR